MSTKVPKTYALDYKMSWHAFDVIGEAYDRTRWLLFSPFSWRFYLTLTLIVLLTSGSSFNQGSGYKGNGGAGSEIQSTIGYVVLGFIALVAILFAVLFGVVSAVFDFIFIDAVATKKIEFVAGFRRRFWAGVRLFAFRILVIIILALIIGAAVGIAVTLGLTETEGFARFLLIVLGIIALVPVFVFFAIVMSFTKDFVAPIMRANNIGVRASWKALLSTMRSNKAQFGVYIIAKTILGIATGMLALMAFVAVLLVFLIVFGIPLAVVAIILYALGFGFASLTALGALSIAIIVIGVILFIAIAILFSYAFTAVTLPIPVFFRYYSLLFLDKIAPQYNVFGEGEKKPEQKQAPEKKPAEKGETEKVSDTGDLFIE